MSIEPWVLAYFPLLLLEMKLRFHRGYIVHSLTVKDTCPVGVRVPVVLNVNG